MQLDAEYFKHLGISEPKPGLSKLLTNMFLILAGGVAGAINEVPGRTADAVNKGIENLTTGNLEEWKEAFGEALEDELLSLI